MRTARLLAVLAALLTVGLSAGLLAPPAGAQPPLRLSDYLTDTAGVLSDSGRKAITTAVDKLYTDRHIRLWVVYVDTFSGQTATRWAQDTLRTSDLGDYDALLAVATTDRAYAFLVPPTIRGVNQSRVDALRHNKIEPALHDGDWSGAAVLAAVICVLTLTIAGPVRTYFAQRTEMNQLAASEAALRRQIADLEQRKAKLADPAYIAAQARERLGFVKPGDIPFQVQLPPTAAEPTQPGSPSAKPVNNDPWYTSLWHTIADAPHLPPANPAVPQAPPAEPGPPGPVPPPAPNPAGPGG